jgi:Uma2 family endonuclease
LNVPAKPRIRKLAIAGEPKKMIAAREYFPEFTPTEYLEWEAKQEFRHEYVDGEVYAMTGGTINHSQIAVNCGVVLAIHLADTPCKVLNSDAKVNIQAANSYLYPDVSVTCDKRDSRATKYISHPCLIIEVLSPSTEAYDRGKKFTLYRQLPSLQEYVLVSTEEISVDIYRKNSSGKWEIVNYRAGDIVELESIDLTATIDRFFKGIVFEDSSETEN